MKYKVAQYSLTCCEGCAVNLINVIARNPMILDRIEIVESRILGIHKKYEHIDIAIVDGSIVTKHDEELVKEIREKSKIVVALGACAHIGGINAVKDLTPHNEALKRVYIYAPKIEHIGSVKPLSDVIKVDYILPGCPAFRQEIEQFFMHIILGKVFRLPDKTVCHDCKSMGLPCLLDFGLPCLGPLTRGGCDALCIQYNNPCWGCRGLAEEPRYDQFTEAIKIHNIPFDIIKDRIEIFLSKTKVLNKIRG